MGFRPLCDLIVEAVSSRIARHRKEINDDQDLSEVKIIVQIDPGQRSIRKVKITRESDHHGTSAPGPVE
jgi:hypothetical protein